MNVRKKTATPFLDKLSRRERQILDILLELGEAGVEEVRSRLPEPPSYSAARTMLTRLEAKGFVEHREKDLRYVYRPAISRSEARESAMKRLVKVFFGGSLAQAATAMIDLSRNQLSREELDELSRKIDSARSRSRSPEGKEE